VLIVVRPDGHPYPERILRPGAFGTRRNIVVMAAKHAVLELDPGGRLDPIRYAEQSAQVSRALALRDQTLVRDAVVGLRDRFRTADAHVQRRALGRLGDQDFFWDRLDTSLVDQLNNLDAQRIRPGWPLRRSRRASRAP